MEIEFDTRIKILQSVTSSFDLDAELAKDIGYQDIPSVDSSLFAVAKKLILAK